MEEIERNYRMVLANAEKLRQRWRTAFWEGKTFKGAFFPGTGEGEANIVNFGAFAAVFAELLLRGRKGMKKGLSRRGGDGRDSQVPKVTTEGV